MFSNLGNPKMMIIAYDDPAMNQTNKVGEFTALLNPEQYKYDYVIEYADNQAQGTSGTAQSFNRVKPRELEFQFLFDKTGAVPALELPGKNGVEDDVKAFKEVVMKWIGDVHRPPYLQLLWGKLNFKCYLTQLTTEYKLFRPDGTPIRALAKAKFKEFIPDDLRVAQEGNNSPDLTHVREVKRGDTLPLMAHRIYGDSSYYLELAKFNQIDHFQELEVGTKIYFPPLADEQTQTT